MFRNVLLTLSCCALAALASPAGFAQSLNIDVGVATPAPALSFGAAAASPGVWSVFANAPTPLVDLAGNPTGITMSGTAGGFLAAYNDPGTFGDDEALIDDGIVVPVQETYTISGLAPGTYDVYTYVWTFNALPTDISINGAPFQTVGGAWPNGFVQGVTHAKHSITLAPSQPLTIGIYSVNGALGSFTGAQLVQTPEPAGAAALLVAAALAKRRR